MSTHSLTIDVPTELIEELRSEAERAQTSLDQEVIRLLEWALVAQRRKGFLDALTAFREAEGDFEEDPDALFGDLRSPDPGRAVDL